ncbi:MAG: FG-GAP-like repeat-containing protein [Calditrichaceae bacterium]
MKFKILSTLILLLVLSLFCEINILYAQDITESFWVSPSGNDTNDGSRTTPFASINYAISKISAGDTVFIEPGDYYEQIIIHNQPDFLLTGSDPQFPATVIAPGAGPVLSVNSDTLSNSNNMEIRNLRLTHADKDSLGVGIEIINSGPSISNCIIVNNKSVEGGGIKILSAGVSAKPLIQKCDIFGNNADSGAGVYAENSSVTILDSRIHENDSRLGGALGYFNSYGLIFQNNQVYNNHAESGGGIYIDAQTAAEVIRNELNENTIFHNQSSKDGGGIYATGDAVDLLLNANSIAENRADSNGGGLLVSGAGESSLQDNIIVGNTGAKKGGAIYLSAMLKSVNLWSNHISGNHAGAQGGAVYIHSAAALIAGGAAELQNDFFHNHASGGLNNIYSENTISFLELSLNYWGKTQESEILATIAVPDLMNNDTWKTAAKTPKPVILKLQPERPFYWFGDGSIELMEEGFNFLNDSLITVTTFTDTSFATPPDDTGFPKLYEFDFSGMSENNVFNLRLTPDFDELALAGNPDLKNLNIIFEDTLNSNWFSLPTLTDMSTGELKTFITVVPGKKFTIGRLAPVQDSLFYTWPLPNQADVPNNSDIQIWFQKTMDESTILAESISIYGGQSGFIRFNHFYDSDAGLLTLRSEKPFINGEEIRVTLKDTIAAGDGSTLADGYSWRFITAAFRGSGDFLKRDIPHQSGGFYQIRPVHLNDDRIPELLQFGGNHLTVYQKEDNLLYSQQFDTVLAETYNIIRTADINYDSRADLLLFNDSKMIVYYYDSQAGGLTEVLQKNIGTGAGLKDVVIRDFNNDGVLDISLLWSGIVLNQLDLYQGSFQPVLDWSGPNSTILSGNSDALAPMDIDGDGLIDLALTRGLADDNITLLKNQSGAFLDLMSLFSGIGNQSRIDAANIWHDNNYANQKEIILSGWNFLSGKHEISLFNSDADGNLSPAFQGELPDSIMDVTTADFNSDGYLDLAVSLANGDVIVYPSRDGGLDFGLNTRFAGDIRAENIAGADLDDDGDIDMLISDFKDGLTSWQVLENVTRSSRSWFVDWQSLSGDGDYFSPFPEIGMALARVSSGDSVFIRGGDYKEQLLINESITISSADSLPVFIGPPADLVTAGELIRIENADSLLIRNIRAYADSGGNQLTGFSIKNTIGSSFEAVASEWLKTGFLIENSNISFDYLEIRHCETGLDAAFSQLELSGFDLEQNLIAGGILNETHANLMDGNISANGLDQTNGLGGLIVESNSVLNMNYFYLDGNGLANIIANGSSVFLQFGMIMNANDLGIAGKGDGIVLNSCPEYSMRNLQIAGQPGFGIRSINSSGHIRNNIFENNDESGSFGGGGVNFESSATGSISNNVFSSSNTAIKSVGGAAEIKYNDFYSNIKNFDGAVPGIGNIYEDPMFVRDYYPFEDVFPVIDPSDPPYHLKLAPGSPLIDAGDPAHFSGDGSRSDMGMFGDAGLPFNMLEVPQVTLNKTETNITLTWNSPAPESDSLLRGIAVFRDTVLTALPDSGSLVVITDKYTTQFVDTLPDLNGIYFYRLAFIDSIGGCTGYSNIVSDALLLNTVLVGTNPDTVSQAKLSFQFAAIDPVDNSLMGDLIPVTFQYRFSRIDSTVASVLDSGQTLERKMDFYPLENGKYRFEVAAVDSAGLGGLGLNEVNVESVVSAGYLDIYRYIWQMISISREVSKIPQNLFENKLLAFKTWRNGAYKSVPADSVIPGKGYWILSNEKIVVDMSKNKFLAIDKPVSVPLEKGWNQVGNPWGWDISWNNCSFTTIKGDVFGFREAIDKGLLGSGIYKWGIFPFRTYFRETDDMIEPDQGFWIKVSEPLQINFNSAPQSVESTETPEYFNKAAQTAANLTGSDVILSLNASGGDMADMDNFYGVCADRSQYPFYYQRASEPPALSDFIKVYSVENGEKISGDLTEFAAESDSKEWQIFVETSNPDNKITLTWDWKVASSGTRLLLYHLDSGVWFDMSDQNSYSIENPEMVNHFKMIATTDADFEPHILPVEFNLFQNYPNPFNPVTKIRLAIPFFADGQEASLIVYDILGRKVKTLLNKRVESGYIEMSWDGMNDRGIRQASGMYIYHFHSGNFSTSKKMILIK